MREYEFTVIYEQDEDGVYVARCPALHGCPTAGDTLEEARELIADAMWLHIEVSLERGEPIPHEVAFHRVRVTV